jgi:hypothetical protein
MQMIAHQERLRPFCAWTESAFFETHGKRIPDKAARLFFLEEDTVGRAFAILPSFPPVSSLFALPILPTFHYSLPPFLLDLPSLSV